MSTCVSQTMTNHHVPGVLSRTTELVRLWHTRYRARQELAAWSERDLHDLGLSRGDVAFEIDKPFWQA
jgi:uncharacterized protein YjiS (DUF1127 family)